MEERKRRAVNAKSMNDFGLEIHLAGLVDRVLKYFRSFGFIENKTQKNLLLF